jgi:hypothetical protein
MPAIGIRLGKMNPSVLEERLAIGRRVILYDEDIRCEGVLRHGKWLEGWVADIVPETINKLAKGEFAKLRAQTRRMAIELVR